MYDKVKIDAVHSAATDNATDYGTILDMSGYEGVMFIASVLKGEAYSLDMKVQQDTDSAMATAADLAGTLVAIDPAVGSDGFGIVDVYRPLERYVRVGVVAADATTPKAVHIIAIRYGAHNKPVSNTNAEFHASPAEGTA